MFGKILKQDFQRLQKKMMFTLLVVLLLFASSILFGKIHIPYLSDIVDFFFYISLWIAFVLINIFIMVDYYKNMYKEEASLTHTLPVSTAQKYWSKVVVSMVYVVIGGAILVALAIFRSYIMINSLDFLSIPSYSTVIILVLAALILTFINQTGIFFIIDYGNRGPFANMGVGGPVLIYIIYSVITQILTILGALFIPFGILLPNDETAAGFFDPGYTGGFHLPGFGPLLFRFESMFSYLSDLINNPQGNYYFILGLGFIPVLIIICIVQIMLSHRSIRDHLEIE